MRFQGESGFKFIRCSLDNSLYLMCVVIQVSITQYFRHLEMRKFVVTLVVNARVLYSQVLEMVATAAPEVFLSSRTGNDSPLNFTSLAFSR